jgi:hypothetical protein
MKFSTTCHLWSHLLIRGEFKLQVWFLTLLLFSQQKSSSIKEKGKKASKFKFLEARPLIAL